MLDLSGDFPERRQPWRGLCWSGPWDSPLVALRCSRGVAGHTGDVGAVCQSRMSSGVCQLPGAHSPWGRAPRYLVERWVCFRAVETCGAGGRALTMSTVAHQMGDNSAVSPGWWRGDTQPWCSWGWGGWRMGPTLMSWLFSPIALLTLSMADDCKYGSSLSVCLSVRCVSVLALPVFVLCGCPCPAHILLQLPTWSISVVPILVLPAWWALAHGPSWVSGRGVGCGKVLDRFTVPGCGEMQGSVMGWEGTVMG